MGRNATYLGVGTSTGHNATFDSQARAVAAGITSDDGDLAVGGNEGSGNKGQKDSLCKHFEGRKEKLAKKDKNGSRNGHVK